MQCTYAFFLQVLLPHVSISLQFNGSPRADFDDQQPRALDGKQPWIVRPPWSGEGQPCTGLAASFLSSARGRINTSFSEHVDSYGRFNASFLSPRGWLKERQNGMPAFRQLHIPKTAGTSFSLDAVEHLDEGIGLWALEGCYSSLKDALEPEDGMVTFVRHPIRHVYSQYLMCAYSCWGRLHSAGFREYYANFSVWINQFASIASDAGFGKFGGVARNSTADAGIGCYHPHNLQVRALTCAVTHENAAHSYLEPVGTARSAERHLRHMYFVGVSELYQESLCVFLAKANGRLPPFCNCEDPESWKSFKPTYNDHGVPNHSVDRDLTSGDLAAVRMLVRDDMKAYREGVDKFLDQLGRAERRHNVKILCKNVSSLIRDGVVSPHSI